MISTVLLLLACGIESTVGKGGDKTGPVDTGTMDPTIHDSDHDGTPDAYDCEPLNFKIHPDANENCDGIDNDCDGKVDEGDYDQDGDGYDDIKLCYLVGGELDCKDDNPDIFPGADEVCDGLDNNCNGQTDEDDRDGDGVSQCEDCDDGNPFIFPGAAEACDGEDNDCDGHSDELWDEDGDGYSPCANDCDETNPDINPAAGELCDGIDNDCTGRADDGWDLDNDGFANCTGDCDETDPNINPSVREQCDGIDNDCDESTDEMVDGDGDGYTVCQGDCEDQAADAWPGNPEVCDDLDNDCNGYFDELESCWACTSSPPYLYCTVSANWSDAKQVCEGLGGNLAMITSAGESSTIDAITTVPTWIGLNDLALESDWVWADGTSLGSYDAWASSQPDGDEKENCVLVNYESGLGDWGDGKCTSRYRFLCEM